MTPARPIGDFSGIDLPESGLAALVRKMDRARATIVYVRKSDPKAHREQAAYLLVQEALPELLVQAGVPRERLVLLEGDTGKSAWLSRKFRADLADLYERIGADKVGTVVVRDVSRMFRDSFLKEPADFCARMARFDTKVLTTFGGEWSLLDLRRDADREQFMKGAREAAAYRKSWRAQSMASKEMSALRGNYTGGPAPFGWAVEAGRARHETPDGVARPPRLVVYPPHAEVKLRIMEASLLPHITSFIQLRRYLLDNGVVVPPFDPETARESFPRSCLSRVWAYLRPDGSRAPVGIDEAFVPSARMLRRILLEPLAVGVRLYGSGDGGKYALRKHQRLAAEMDMPPDTLVRPDRVWVGTFPELALCRTPEQVALYWRVAEKWSPTDLREAVRSRFEQAPPNAGQSAGKPRMARFGYKIVNPWAQRVWCLKHGRGADGAPALTHPMALHGSGTSWACYKDYRTQGRDGACSAWACDNVLGRILDAHLLRGITAALEGQHAIIRSLSDDRDERKRAAEKLRQEVADLERERERQLDQADALRRSLEGMEKGFADAELDRFHRERVRPVLASLAEKQRDLRRADDDGLAAPPDTSEREVREVLRRLVDGWDTIPLDEKRFAISVFVARVGVLVGDGAEGKEALVEFAWTDGVVDRLVGWRGPCKDERPWTAEEDEAIRRLWPSGCDWPEIKAELLPRRTFRRVRARARELGVAKGANRSNAWVDRHLDGDRSWGERHPEVLYLHLHPEDGRWCLAVGREGGGTVMETPEEVGKGLAALGHFIATTGDTSRPSSALLP
jgi:hypothetical protein